MKFMIYILISTFLFVSNAFAQAPLFNDLDAAAHDFGMREFDPYDDRVINWEIGTATADWFSYQDNSFISNYPHARGVNIFDDQGNVYWADRDLFARDRHGDYIQQRPHNSFGVEGQPWTFFTTKNHFYGSIPSYFAHSDQNYYFKYHRKKHSTQKIEDVSFLVEIGKELPRHFNVSQQLCFGQATFAVSQFH